MAHMKVAHILLILLVSMGFCLEIGLVYNRIASPLAYRQGDALLQPPLRSDGYVVVDGDARLGNLKTRSTGIELLQWVLQEYNHYLMPNEELDRLYDTKLASIDDLKRVTHKLALFTQPTHRTSDVKRAILEQKPVFIYHYKSGRFALITDQRDDVYFLLDPKLGRVIIHELLLHAGSRGQYLILEKVK